MSEGIVIIKKGREKPIIQQHPWIFSGAIAHAENANPGGIVTVLSQERKFLTRGYWNPKSQIQVRILTWKDEEINEDWWRRTLQRAIDARDKYIYDNPAYRLINAENDYVPGLIVDSYDGWLVLQALTLYVDLNKEMFVRLLVDICHPKGIYERSDVDVRGKEGLDHATGLLWGDEPPEYVEISEGYMFKVKVDIRKGHKTGFYLDQVDNRGLLGELLFQDGDFSLNSSVLNLFSYTGAFCLHCIDRVERVVNIDASMEALELAELNVIHSKQFAIKRAEFIQADVFEYIRDAVERGEQYDVIVCDPPKFAHSAKQIEGAARGYKDLNLHCFKMLKPGGYLMTFSCSGAISPDLFQKIVFGALADSGRQAQILKHLGAADDHPIALTFPEGEYLKGLLLRVY